MNKLLNGQILSTFFQAIAILVTPYIYSKDEIGFSASILAASMTLAQIATLRMESAIPLLSSKYKQLKLKLFCLTLIFFLFAVLSVIVSLSLLFRVFSFNFSEKEGAFFGLLAVIIIALLTALGSVLNYDRIAKRDYAKSSSAKAIQAAANVVFPLVLVGLQKPGLIIAQICSNIVLIIYLCDCSKRSLKSIVKFTSRKLSRSDVFQAIRYAMPEFASGLLILLSQQGFILLMSSKHGFSGVGTFSVFTKFFGLPSAIIGNALYEWHLSRALEVMAKKNRAEILRSIFLVALYTASLFGFSVLFAGGFVFKNILAGAYYGENVIMYSALIINCGTVVSAPLFHVFAGSGKPLDGFKEQAKLNGIRCVGILICLLTKSFLASMVVFAVSNLLGYFIFIRSCLRVGEVNLGGICWSALGIVLKGLLHSTPLLITYQDSVALSV
jgi:O-antigen/teichoic acid export membrane protein